MKSESKKRFLIGGVIAVILGIFLLVLSGVIPDVTATLLGYLLHYRYSTLFAVIFFSAIIVPVPANTVLLAVGAFSTQGYFDFGWAALTALVANVLGDVIGYYITYIYGHAMAKKLKLPQYSYFTRLRSFVKSHPISTVFITRFITSLGSIVNFIAGLVPIPFTTFIVYDILGNLLNLLFFLYVGALVGNYWERFSDIFSWVGGIIGLGIVAVVFIKTFRKSDM